MSIFKCPNCNDEPLPDGRCWKCGADRTAMIPPRPADVLQERWEVRPYWVSSTLAIWEIWSNRYPERIGKFDYREHADAAVKAFNAGAHHE